MDIPVKDMHLKNANTMQNLHEQFLATGGFTAKKLAEGTNILRDMFAKSKLNILSFPAAVVSTGTRGVLVDLVKSGKFQMIMTTCGTLDHDFARVWKDYHHGSFDDDDRELHKQKKHRLGNLRIPESHYGLIIEEKLQPMLTQLYKEGKRKMGTHEFVWELGRLMDKEKKKEESLIWWCWKTQTPMIIPGITDGAFGLQLLMFMQDHRDFVVDPWMDEFYLLGRMFDKSTKGALMLGGGISKHHTIWWCQFAQGLDYAVYITTAPEWDGSLSGARVEEGISWGKVNEKAKFVTVEGEVTMLLPLLVAPLL